jgi:hypothetical protein
MNVEKTLKTPRTQWFRGDFGFFGLILCNTVLAECLLFIRPIQTMLKKERNQSEFFGGALADCYYDVGLGKLDRVMAHISTL